MAFSSPRLPLDEHESSQPRSPTSSPSHSARSNPRSKVESSIARLLADVKQLLESLTRWSTLQLTETQISDVYVRLGNDFNATVAAFDASGIDMSDLISFPDDLRDVLETCLGEDATPDNLAIYLPKVRAIITRLLQGLRSKQATYRRITSEQHTTPQRHDMAESQKMAASRSNGHPSQSQSAYPSSYGPPQVYVSPQMYASPQEPPPIPLAQSVPVPASVVRYSLVDKPVPPRPMSPPATITGEPLPKGKPDESAKRMQRPQSPAGVEVAISGPPLSPSSDPVRQLARTPSHLCKLSEHLGDTALDDGQHAEAISHYTAALSLKPHSPQAVLVKRGKAFAAAGSWEQALDDANQAITFDPSSPWPYEVKHAALHVAGDYNNAIDAFEVMLSKIEQSPDPDIQQLSGRYISPSSTRATIRSIVQRTIRHLPRVLINTTTGRLHDRAKQASAFESLPVFNELVSSMTTRIDYVRMKREVRQYFRYVMLSHKREDNEPLFQQVVHTAVYDLDKSPTHDKLQTFCKIVRDAEFAWAWCDTCCINKSDHFVLQEALVAMFKWYQGSTMIIVFLRGVRSASQLGALVKSIWNTRAWTLQEYIASRVIHFYTKDWTPYLDLKLPNHKESLEVISEMEQITGVTAQQLMALRSGLSGIREKLRLASTRNTTLVEDAAYSLLGIFSVTGIPAIYGEGEGSLGRLLAHVLAGSGDVSILAWTGESGNFNSCLPAHITVFNGPATSHLPSPIPNAEMERIITISDSSSFDLDMALKLYDRLNDLPAPWFAASRVKLPCIAFQLPSFSQSRRTRSIRIYRADTVAFGLVEIKTRHDLSRMKSLYLVHPWLDTLLEREDQGNVIVEEEVTSSSPPNTDDEEIFDNEIDEEEIDEEIDDNSSLPPEPELTSHVAPLMDRETRARRLVAHLKQPFGALLVTLASTGGRAVDYKRVAADSVITVQFQESVPLADILDNVHTLDVL